MGQRVSLGSLPQKYSNDNAVGSSATIGLADITAKVIEAVQILDIPVDSATTLTEMLRSSDLSPATLAVIAEFSGTTLSAITAIDSSVALVAPALVLVDLIIGRIAYAAANLGLVAALLKRVGALRPVLRAATRAATATRKHAGLLAEIAAVLKAANEAVRRVTQRGYVITLLLASSEKAAIDDAEAVIDSCLPVLSAAVAATLGGKTLALKVASDQAAAEARPCAATHRAALVARCGDDSPPGAWRAAAKAAGVSGADAFLCHLSRSIDGALERLAASVEAAQLQLQSLRESRAADVVALSYCDELESSVETAESSKRAILERELCAVDLALENLRAERSATAEAAAFLGDAELMTRYPELTAGLDAVEAQLLTLPTTFIEPLHVALVIDEHALLAGRIVAPRAVTAVDLTLEGVPSRVYSHCPLLLRLVLRGTQHVSQSAEELEVSLGAAAAATHVEATLETEGVAHVPGRCLSISISIPVTALAESFVCIGHLTVSGQRLAGLLGAVRVMPPCPADLSPEHVAWLRSVLPPGGSRSPGTWEEVYRATTHGFGATHFHARCDGRARLLVLVRARGGGWLFGGFTAVGFRPPTAGLGSIADPCAFLFSLTNSLGHPEKLESKRSGNGLYYNPSATAIFCGGLLVCPAADTKADSWTWTGRYFEESASTGVHPMARGRHEGWLVAEVVAWVV